MLNSEYYKLRYRIPNFLYATPPSLNLIYDVYITKKNINIPDEVDKMDSYSWIYLGNCYADKQGNVFSNSENTLPFEIILGEEYGTSFKIKITGFTTFILKFVNITVSTDTKVHYSQFTTGLNIGMFDSPYRDKVLMPEQTYAITYDVEACDNLPTKNDLSWFYYIQDGKTYEALYLNMNSIGEDGEITTDNDIWVSLKSSDEDILLMDLKTQECENINPVSIKGVKIYSEKGTLRYFSLPYTHTKGNTYGYYWNSNRDAYNPKDDNGDPIDPVLNVTGERGMDGVGAIRANDIATLNSSIGFAFYIDENQIEGSTITLCHYEMNETLAEYDTSFKLYIKDKKIYVNAKEGNFTGFNEFKLFDTDIEYNKWYYISLGNYQKLYTILDGEIDETDNIKKYGIELLGSQKLTPFATLDSLVTSYDRQHLNPATSFFPGASYLKTNPGVNGEQYGFHFGGDGVEGLYISGIGGTCKSYSNGVLTSNVIEDSVVAKILRPDLHMPYLKILGYKNNKYTGEIVSSEALNTSLNSAKGEMSFYINSDIYNKVLKSNQIIFDYIVIQIINNRKENKVINQKMYCGYISGNDVLSGMFPITDYLEDSFTLNFKDIYDSDPNNAEKKLILELSTRFVTKHGTWGGYNGGCSGHLLYFNGDKNLVLEAHGDDYIPYGDDPNDKTTAEHPKGVGKETLNANGVALLADELTGYGTDVFWDKFDWDKRKYKNYLRTGSSLVSNKYFSYGRVDVTMKIPKLNVGKYNFGICPALWFFHYIETYPEIKERWDKYPYKNLAIEGDDAMGEYKVLNNEIDIELPSHLINGKARSFKDLSQAYFATWEQANLVFNYDEAKEEGYFNPTDYDHVLIDDQTHITVDNVLYRYKGRGNDPHDRTSWVLADYGKFDTRCYPSFRNCKFNMWIGEYNSGDGWTATEEEYFDSKYRENYQSMLTRAADNWYGYADGHFHTWSIVWTPTKSVLLIDGVPFRVGRGYIPVNVMKYTVALWFPTIPRAVIKQDNNGVSKYKKTNDNTPNGIGLLDTDGLFEDIGDELNGTRALLEVTDETDIGTWAGRRAYWETFLLEISEIKYTRYKERDSVKFKTYYTFDEEGNPITHQIEDEIIHLTDFSTAEKPPVQPEPGTPNLIYLGESYPESGLRILAGQDDTMKPQLVSTVFLSSPNYQTLQIRNITKNETTYTTQSSNVYICNKGDIISYKMTLPGYDEIEETKVIESNSYVYHKIKLQSYESYLTNNIISKINSLSDENKSNTIAWAVMTDFHLFTPESKDKTTKDTFDNTLLVIERGVGALKRLSSKMKDVGVPLKMIALTGDVCGYTDELQTANVKSIQIFKNINKVYNTLSGCEAPFMGIPGNHDVYGGGDAAHKNDLVQVNYDPKMLYNALIDRNPNKDSFKFLDTQYICSSYYDTEKIRFVFLDTFIPSIICRYNFHSGTGGVAEEKNSSTGPCYGGENLTLAVDENGSHILAEEVNKVMLDIMDKTRDFLKKICKNLNGRKLVVFSHQCTRGWHVHTKYKSDDGETTLNIEGRLTPLLYDKLNFPYPKDAKFYSGVSSYATAYWLGHEGLSELSSFSTNDIWNNGWSEVDDTDYNNSDFKDWMTLIKENLVAEGVPLENILINCFGHCHTDNQAIDNDDSNILYVSTQYACSLKSGSNDTVISAVDHRHYNQFDNFEGPYHTPDEISETAFDIYLYNYETNQIQILRYGNGCDRKFTCQGEDAKTVDNYVPITEADYSGTVYEYNEKNNTYIPFIVPELYINNAGKYIKKENVSIAELMSPSNKYWVPNPDTEATEKYLEYEKPTLYANHSQYIPSKYKWVMDRVKAPTVNISNANEEDIPRLTIYIADLTGTVEDPDTAIMDNPRLLLGNTPHSALYIGYKEWYICTVDKLNNATLYITPTDDDSEHQFDETDDSSSSLKGVQLPLYLTKDKKYWYCIYNGNDIIKNGTFTNNVNSINL